MGAFLLRKQNRNKNVTSVFVIILKRIRKTGEKLSLIYKLRQSVYEFFSEQESFWNQTPKELNQKAVKFHIAPDFFYREQQMSTLSGGEKVKAQLMRILFAEPTVLLLDEPADMMRI